MTKAVEMTPAELARACAAAMWSSDKATQTLGMELLDIGPGTAKIAMTISDTMTNGHGSAHGGFMFTLADTTFAFACNTHNERAVAAQCAITFLRPGRCGSRLIATAREITRAGRSGIYDVTIRDGDVTIAEFRGHSRVIGGAWVGPESG